MLGLLLQQNLPIIVIFLLLSLAYLRLTCSQISRLTNNQSLIP